MADPTQQELFANAVAPPAQPEPQSAPEPAAEAPAPETPAEPAAPAAVEASIPSWRLREETEARRAAEERMRQLEEHIRQLQGQQVQAKPPNFFDNPDQATNELIVRALTPFAQQTQQQLMAMGRMVAESVHTPDVVSQAEEAFLEAMNDKTLDPVDYERVVQAPNRYDAAVKWYRNQSVLSTVGNDPSAWFQAQLEQQLADPKFQASLLEKIRGSAATKPGAVKLPPSLSKATAAQANSGDVGDGSDASIFAYATKR